MCVTCLLHALLLACYAFMWMTHTHELSWQYPHMHLCVIEYDIAQEDEWGNESFLWKWWVISHEHESGSAQSDILQHTAAHCNTLQHTAAHCNTLRRTATHCTMQHIFNIMQRTATHCNALQRTATHCNALQHTATHCNTLQHIATYCNTALVQTYESDSWGQTFHVNHTATHCNALQHTAKLRVVLATHQSMLLRYTLYIEAHVAVCCRVL